MPLPSAADIDIELPGWARLLAVLAVGVALSGLADFALTQAGYPTLATFVWATGYAGTIIVVWLVWGQHLDLVGDTGVGHETDPEENVHADDGEQSDPY
ncbi:hypothetical protein [Haloglomus litoreum]|uniref:hypothetical protein n=1 Tax=Haloglomus litoreum TaxID=3034026 RepID=UPI0023E8CB90|nr:hypothetical protein [Haloglomus sp. DT116]